MKTKSKLLALFLGLGMVSCNPISQEYDADNLYEQFLTPPNEARPRVWWHWMNGNITKDGILKDILWMERAGIGGFHHFDAGLRTQQIVDKRLIYMDEGWKDAFNYAVSIADSLGMEVAVASAPGWSNTGGPWVKPENAMKKVTWREFVIEGGEHVSITLPEPFEDTGKFLNCNAAENSNEFYSPKDTVTLYEDIAVIAVPLQNDDRLLDATLTSSGGKFSIEELNDGDFSKSSFLPRDDKAGYSWIAYEFERPVTVKALSVADGLVRAEGGWAQAPVTKYFEASDDGKQWTLVTAVPHGSVPRQTVSFPGVTAKHFRMRFENPVEDHPYSPRRGQPKPGTNIAEFALYSATKINHVEEKAGFSYPHDAMDNLTPDDSSVPSLSGIRDITDKVDQSGNLSWDTPAGTWRIYRIGCSLTGKKNSPAPPEATGYEVDKMDPDAMNDYINTYLDMYLQATGGMMGEKGIQYLLIDSYEAGTQTWTKKMPEEFLRRRGYSLLPWLPVLTGQLVESAEKSEQFLWDWRKTIGELVTETLYGEVSKAAKERGLKCYFESHENGRAYLADGMDVKCMADIPMAAIWTPQGDDTQHLTAECDIRESASAAHICGHKIVASESFSTRGLNGNGYSYYPGNLKPVADLALACGLNRFVIHESAHQPVDDKKPGVGLMIFGQWFNRHETWAEQAKAWTDYLSRSSFMMQQGIPVTDILYYYGEDNCVTAMFPKGFPEIPAGYSFDYAGANVLLNWISAEGKQLTTKSGMSYRILVIDRNARSMSLPVLRKLAELVKKGVTVCGQKPERDPSLADDKQEWDNLISQIYGSGRKNVMEGKTAGEALAALGVEPDFMASDMNGLRFVHRSVGKTEFYWVSNAADNARNVRVSLRTEGKKPQVWHPETGEAEDVSYSISTGRTEVELNLTEHDAVFIVLREKATEKEFTVNKPTEILFRHVDTPWQVSFPDGKTVTMNQLVSLTESQDPDIKYFSGTATYTNTLTIAESELKQGRFKMRLGKVGCLAEVIVNNKNLGTLWRSPYELDVTEALQPEENIINVRVTNLWKNRIIGDLQPECKNPSTFPAWQFYNVQSPLSESGLMGPVDLFIEQDNRQPYDRIYTGQIWLDTNGKPIQAHGFQVVEADGTYYWYGENKEFTVTGSNVWTYGIRCYKSNDFYNWEDCGLIIEPDTTDILSPLHYSQLLDRPHIIYCKKTGKYVCWIKDMEEDGYYVVLQADDLLGPYSYVRSVKPHGYGVGDFDLWVDPETDKAYIWFERPHWELICSDLSDDYTDAGERFSTHYTGMKPPLTREAPTHFVHDGKHYLFTSGTTGYVPNETKVCTFTDPHGVYTDLGNPHPADKYHHSFCSQITDVVVIPETGQLVAVADRWMPQTFNTFETFRKAEWIRLIYMRHKPVEPDFSIPKVKDKSKQVRGGWDVTYNATYVFLPIEWNGDKPEIQWKEEWKL